MSDNIRQCKCSSRHQDMLYGTNMRVTTPGKNQSCTVCGTPHASGSSGAKKK